MVIFSGAVQTPPEVDSRTTRKKSARKPQNEPNLFDSLGEESKEKVNPKTLNYSDLEGMTVEELRRLARKTLNFPIYGREISHANKSTLLEYFKQII